MKYIFILILTLATVGMFAQEECLISFVSGYNMENTTPDTVIVEYDNINQKSFPTEGPISIVIAPGETQKVCSLEWAQEFKYPTIWYHFKLINSSGDSNPNDQSNWKKVKQGKYEATYLFKIE